MAKITATATEVAAARAFLKFLGADWHSDQLILAVLAWARGASGKLSGSLGLNPFHVRRFKDTFAIHVGGTAATFTSLSAAFVAAAKALKYMAGLGGPDQQGYKDILLSLKSGSAGEFLNAVAMSAWSPSHYGLTIDPETGKIGGKNKLGDIYNNFAGLITPEAQAAADAENAKRQREYQAAKEAAAKEGRRPHVLNPPIIGRDYTNAWAADRFYRARHKAYEPPD